MSAPPNKCVHDVIGRTAPTSMHGKPPECLEVETGIAYHEGDVYVVTYPKTGTTVLQYMCHLLRMNGEGDDFEDIHQVCPHTSSAWFIGQDLNAIQPGTPRLFKSHRELQQVAPFASGVKFICTIRDPTSTLHSLFNFRQARGQKQAGDVYTFAKSDLWSVANHDGCIYTVFDHIATFWQCKDCANMLLIPYEDLVIEPKLWLPVMAKFLGVHCEDDVINKIAQKTSKAAMLKSLHKFDESWTKIQRDLLCRVNPNIGTKSAPKVNAAESEFERRNRLGSLCSETDHGDMSAEEVELTEWQRYLWDKKVLPATGMKSYEEMRTVLRREKLNAMSTDTGAAVS